MWGDPGVSEQTLILENNMFIPATTGGVTTMALQRAGLLRRLRAFFYGTVAQSAATAAPSKSAHGSLGGAILRFRVDANGRVPLVDLSGIGLMMYNEIQNRDGSPWATPQAIAANSLAQTTDLSVYTTPTTGATTYYDSYPFEIQFGLPVMLQGRQTELGLWLLQNQAIDLNVEITFNPAYVATGPFGAYNAGTGAAATWTVATSYVALERELYSVPLDPKNYPNLSWAHQVIEFSSPFTGYFSRFNIPRAGLILRVASVTLDGSNLVVDASDISKMQWVYGSNETPISRPGWAMTNEFEMDYNRLPPKGLALLDFYKWGEQGLKLVKNSEELANLRLETTYTGTAAGTQKIIIDRLVPVAAR